MSGPNILVTVAASMRALYWIMDKLQGQSLLGPNEMWYQTKCRKIMFEKKITPLIQFVIIGL